MYSPKAALERGYCMHLQLPLLAGANAIYSTAWRAHQRPTETERRLLLKHGWDVSVREDHGQA